MRFEEQSQPPLRLLLWLFVRPPLWWLLLLQRVTTWLPSAFPPSQHHPSGQSDSAKIRSRRCSRIGRISLRTANPLFHDSYRRNRLTGSFILVDPGTHETVAAGMIV